MKNYTVIEVRTNVNKKISKGDWLYCQPIKKENLIANTLYAFSIKNVGIVFRKLKDIVLKDCDAVYSIQKRLVHL